MRFGSLPRTLSHAQGLGHSIIHRIIARPRLAVLVALVLVTLWGWYGLYRLPRGPWGRWYWNYLVGMMPPLANVLPAAWNPVENEPRFIPEIFNAPWMGTWTLPELSAPVRNASWPHHTYPNHLSHFVSPSAYISPSIVKLHVFSKACKSDEGAGTKRQLIRVLHPARNVPPELAHLIELKFIVGRARRPDGTLDEEVERSLDAEQAEYGDLVRLDLLKNGENLREGKILDWVHAVGSGNDGGRPSWWLFKVDDDTVLRLPNFLDSLLTFNAHDPYYLGTSLNRWPSYHAHFTGMLTGFSWGVVKTMAHGIARMTREEIEKSWDDDVMTGEIMFNLPSGPNCRRSYHPFDITLPKYCNPHQPPRWGYQSVPPRLDLRSGLRRHDYLRHMGDPEVWFIKGDIARHTWWYKTLEGYEQEWRQNVEGKMWVPPKAFAIYEETLQREHEHGDALEDQT